MANVLSLVSYKIFPAKLGGQKGIALFNQHFSRYHKLVCVTIKDNDPKYAEYTVLNILSNSRLRYINLFYFFTLRRIIKNYKISHMILEHPYYGWLGVLLKCFCGVKFIVHSHNIEAHRFKSLGKWWWRILLGYEKFVHRQADQSFCITEDDKAFMIKKFKLDPGKCAVITYGIEWEVPPSAEERNRCRAFLNSTYGFEEEEVLFLFNGTLDYAPNLNAVKIILDQINPIMLLSGNKYRIIICGKNLPEAINIHSYADKNIIYPGFVDDISVFFKGADVFINPVTEGGGIKTKLVEALGSDLNAVSTLEGAIGVDPGICNEKLLLSRTGWKDFAEKMLEAGNLKQHIGPEYFQHFYWDNIARKAAEKII